MKKILLFLEGLTNLGAFISAKNKSIKSAERMRKKSKRIKV